MDTIRSTLSQIDFSKFGKFKIDIGLSYGAPHSDDWINKDGKDLLVFGFEPYPDSVTAIRDPNNKKRSPYHAAPIKHEYIDKNFFIIPVALSNVEGTVDFYVTNNDVGCSSLFEPKVGSGLSFDKKISVDCYTLATFFELLPWDKIKYIEYIKIDAQGSDLNILKGAGKYLSDKVVYVTAEPGGNQYLLADNCTENQLNVYMESLGFKQIKHKKTIDPTFVNLKYLDVANDIYISQFG